jgi:hypothetical protein
MKISHSLKRFALAGFFFIAFFACKKSLTDELISTIPTTIKPVTRDSVTLKDTVGAQTTPPEVPFPVVINVNCNGPEYGDSVIYPQPVGLLQSYIVNPVNNPGPGQYFSWPQGLSINSTTGAINVTQSESGQRYAIGFVKSGTNDTCMTSVIIGGAAYSDGVYVLESNQTLAAPYYNANPALPPVCTGSSNGKGCVWDVNGLAKLQRVEIDKHTGIIDLQKTISNGAFGPLLLNGATIQTTIYYQLTDASNMATQSTPVKFIYYNKRSDVPQSLLDQITNKQNNILQDILILLGGNPRPPLIVITRYSN